MCGPALFVRLTDWLSEFSRIFGYGFDFAQRQCLCFVAAALLSWVEALQLKSIGSLQHSATGHLHSVVVSVLRQQI